MFLMVAGQLLRGPLLFASPSSFISCSKKNPYVPSPINPNNESKLKPTTKQNYSPLFSAYVYSEFTVDIVSPLGLRRVIDVGTETTHDNRIPHTLSSPNCFLIPQTPEPSRRQRSNSQVPYPCTWSRISPIAIWVAFFFIFVVIFLYNISQQKIATSVPCWWGQKELLKRIFLCAW